MHVPYGQLGLSCLAEQRTHSPAGYGGGGRPLSLCIAGLLLCCSMLAARESSWCWLCGAGIASVPAAAVTAAAAASTYRKIVCAALPA